MEVSERFSLSTDICGVFLLRFLHIRRLEDLPRQIRNVTYQSQSSS